MKPVKAPDETGVILSCNHCGHDAFRVRQMKERDHTHLFCDECGQGFCNYPDDKCNWETADQEVSSNAFVQ